MALSPLQNWDSSVEKTCPCELELVEDVNSNPKVDLAAGPKLDPSTDPKILTIGDPMSLSF